MFILDACVDSSVVILHGLALLKTSIYVFKLPLTPPCAQATSVSQLLVNPCVIVVFR